MRIALLIPLLFFAVSSSSQSNWARSIGGNSTDEGLAVATDASGNTYTTGFFSGSFSVGPSTLTSNGITDVFVAKTNANGIVEWAVSAGGSSVDRGLDIEVDDSGNVVVTGYYTGSATFGATTLTAAGGQDIFVAKYSSTGSLIWAYSAGGIESEQGNGIAVDDSGNVLVTGQFQGSADFGPVTLNSMVNPTTGNNSIDVFTLKLTPGGVFTWVEQGSAKQTDRGLDVTTDASGNIYIVGQFSDSITFDVSHPNLISNAVFVVKYNNAGVEQWFRKIGASVSIAYGISTSGNNVFVTGDFQGTLIFYGSPNNFLSSSYSKKIFIGHYNLGGTYQNSVALGSDNLLSSRDITVDSSGSCYILGNFECSFTEMTQNYGPSTFLSVGYQDIFVAKFNSGLSLQWSRQFGGPNNDFAGGIGVNVTDHPVISGTYNDTFNFPSTPAWLGYGTTAFSGATTPYCGDPYYNQFLQLNSQGVSDAFVAAPVDTGRSHYDFYNHPSATCDLSALDVHIHSTNYDTLNPVDSIESCTFVPLFFNTFITPGIGPDINYEWWNGNTIVPAALATTTSWYSIETASTDGCFVNTDSIHITVHTGAFLTITDDVVINSNTSAPIPIHICPPDTVQLTGGNYAGLDSVQWSSGETFTTIDSVTIEVTSGGYYDFTAIDSFGCIQSVSVLIIEDQFIVLDSIYPKIKFDEDPDGNDTITACEDDILRAFAYDTISNAAGQDIPLSGIKTWTVTPLNLIGSNYFQLYQPDSSGWHYFEFNIIISFDNECGSDTLEFNVVDSIYIDLLASPDPLLNIISSTGTDPVFLCPGDSIQLTASTDGTVNWWPGNYLGASTDTTITVWLPDEYTVLTTLTDTLTGCVGNKVDEIEVFYKPIPIINASSNILCPNDSVSLSVAIPGSYQWYGPNGPINLDTNTIYVQDPGFYYVVVNDTDNCELVSNSMELVQYTTPGITGTPSAHLCPGDPGVIIQVETADATGINWLPPLSGSSITQFVTSPGTYSADVTGCGVTVTATITVTGSTPTSSITPITPTVLCPGDTFEIAANPGMTGYLWLPVVLTDSAIQTPVPGTYTLIATDQYGCTDTSSILLSNHPIPNPPSISNTVSCYGDPVTMNATGTGNTTWLDSSMTNLWTGNSYTTPPNFGPVTYWVYLTHIVTGCISDTIPVTVTIDPIYQGINVSSNSPVCEGNTINLAAQNVPGGSYSWIGPNFFTATNQSPAIFNASLNDSGYYIVSVFNGLCSSPGDSVYVEMIPSPDAPIVSTMSPVCTGDTIAFSVTPVPGESYTWSGPGYAAFGSSNFIFPATLANSGIYSVYATANGCVSNLTTFNIDVLTTPTPVVTSNAPICEGDTLMFHLEIDSESVFSWNDPNGVLGTDTILIIPNAQASPTGYYFLEATLGPCPIDPLNLSATVYSYPIFDLGDTITVCEDSILTYSVDNSFTAFEWHDGSNQSYYDTDGDEDFVAVTVTNGVCLRSDTAYINYYSCYLDIPNIFTPNGDGINDVFYVESEGALDIYVEIYNRWGQLVGKYQGVDNGWNGTHIQTSAPMSEGVYYYIAKVTKYNNEVVEQAGFLHLVSDNKGQ